MKTTYTYILYVYFTVLFQPEPQFSPSLEKDHPSHQIKFGQKCYDWIVWARTYDAELLTLIQPGEVIVDLANFDVIFRKKFSYVGFFKNYPIPAEMSCESFWTSDMTSKNDILTYILTFLRQKFSRGTTIPTSPLPTGFTVNTDHLSAGEVRPGRGPQCRATPGTFLPISRPGLRRVRGEADSQSGLALSK